MPKETAYLVLEVEVEVDRELELFPLYAALDGVKDGAECAVKFAGEVALKDGTKVKAEIVSVKPWDILMERPR